LTTDLDDLSRLEGDILSRKKYQSLDPVIVRQIGQQELTRRKNYKSALRSARARLHQAACVFQLQDLDYPSVEKELAALPRSIDAEETRDFCLRLMKLHASSKERLPILEHFFNEIAGEMVGINSILDCACGLNPLSLPWTPWKENIRYDACDVFTDMVGFVQKFLDHFGIKGNACTCDLSRETPAGEYDLVLLLKTLPCLEQLEKNSTARLLKSIQGRYLLVSYPVASLGGHQKGMIRNYTHQFESLTAEWQGEIKRFEFETELAFLLIREPCNP
jgi:16S rRNA (guanine(1405)-N(7))-methyltransferase